MQMETIENKTTNVLTVKLQSHPLLVLIQTMKVTPSIAPEVRLHKYQLKKLDNLDASFGSLSSNWSAPKAGKAALTPLVPNATRYSPVYSIAAWLPVAASHWFI
jgi:hypothetical protein